MRLKKSSTSTDVEHAHDLSNSTKGSKLDFFWAKRSARNPPFITRIRTPSIRTKVN
ncbi:unnamed protein product [Brassica oleracea]